MRRLALLLAALLAAPAPASSPAQETAPLRALAAHEQLEFSGVGRLDFGDGYCTATLFDSRHALTAAHCLYDRRGNRRPAAQLWFRAGFRGAGEQAIRQVSRAAAHPDYRWNGPRASLREIAADVALLELDQPLLESEFPGYGPAALPGPGGAVALLSYGSGRDRVLSLQEPCRVLDRRGAVARLDCDAAPGSSGGPVLVRDREGRLRLAGVVSAIGGGASFAAVASETLPQLRRALEADRARPRGPGPSAAGETDHTGRRISRPPPR
jgi:protease YdgD